MIFFVVNTYELPSNKNCVVDIFISEASFKDNCFEEFQIEF